MYIIINLYIYHSLQNTFSTILYHSLQLLQLAINACRNVIYILCEIILRIIYIIHSCITEFRLYVFKRSTTSLLDWNNIILDIRYDTNLTNVIPEIFDH